MKWIEGAGLALLLALLLHNVWARTSPTNETSEPAAAADEPPFEPSYGGARPSGWLVTPWAE
jgi:hypothetical protein